MVKTVLFDFDGVILDSMPVREYGFRKIFSHYNKRDVDMLIIYHNSNGGLSRYVKIKYFYENILKQEISNEKIKIYAENFSSIMKKELVKSQYLIQETVDFIQSIYQQQDLYIVSGSDEKELKYLCEKLELTQYFKEIYGSPIQKVDLIKNILGKNHYKNNDVILIGDSINDYEAAQKNSIRFFAYNNRSLKKITKKYIETFREFKIKT